MHTHLAEASGKTVCSHQLGLSWLQAARGARSVRIDPCAIAHSKHEPADGRVRVRGAAHGHEGSGNSLRKMEFPLNSVFSP